MRDTLLHITAQVHEGGKAKGGQVFSLMVDSDAFMYAEKQCIKVLQDLLTKYGNEHYVYTYVSHELVFMGIEALDAEEFETRLQKELEAEHEAEVINNQAEEHKAMSRYEQGLGTD